MPCRLARRYPRTIMNENRQCPPRFRSRSCVCVTGEATHLVRVCFSKQDARQRSATRRDATRVHETRLWREAFLDRHESSSRSVKLTRTGATIRESCDERTSGRAVLAFAPDTVRHGSRLARNWRPVRQRKLTRVSFSVSLSPPP